MTRAILLGDEMIVSVIGATGFICKILVRRLHAAFCTDDDRGSAQVEEQIRLNNQPSFQLELSNIEEDRVPDTPTSVDSLNQLHKKLLMLEKRDSGADESLEGSVSSEWASQKNFCIQEFELGKINGIGSYSKVVRAKKKSMYIVIVCLLKSCSNYMVMISMRTRISYHRSEVNFSCYIILDVKTWLEICALSFRSRNYKIGLCLHGIGVYLNKFLMNVVMRSCFLLSSITVFLT